MSGSFFSLSVDPKARRLSFAMGPGLRVALLVAWLSLTVALVPALVPGTGVVIEPEGWVPAGVLWALVTLGLGWRDRWVFDAAGTFHRERGWAVLVHRRTRPLAGFGGWIVETHPTRRLDPAGRRGTVEFRTAQGLWRIDARFRADWLEAQRPALELWSGWLAEGGSRGL